MPNIDGPIPAISNIDRKTPIMIILIMNYDFPISVIMINVILMQNNHAES